MTKIMKCPECGESKPVRDDAKVCSPRCRVRRWRKKKKRDKDMKTVHDTLVEYFIPPIIQYFNDSLTTWEMFKGRSE